MDARTPESIVSSPLNMHCSLSEPGVSEVNVGSAVQIDHGYTSDINETINYPVGKQFLLSPLHYTDGLSETSSESDDRSRDPSSRRHRRSPPPPRRMSQSGNSRILSDTSGDSDSDTPRRSHSVRPPQSPRQARTPRSPTNISFPSPGPLSPDPAMISSLSRLAQNMNTLASSIVTEGLSRQAPGRQRLRCNDDYGTKTNCVDINGSNVDGLTLNNGGTNNSGAGTSFFCAFSRFFLTVEPNM
jgi:hypothetical protein